MPVTPSQENLQKVPLFRGALNLPGLFDRQECDARGIVESAVGSAEKSQAGTFWVAACRSLGHKGT